MKYKIDPHKFATVLTSCGRFDLLGETVASFQRYFDVERILIAEDSEDSASAAAFGTVCPATKPRCGRTSSTSRSWSLKPSMR